MADKVKFEYNCDDIKRAIMSDEGSIFKPDQFEAYFYLNEKGEPIFVIEEK